MSAPRESSVSHVRFYMDEDDLLEHAPAASQARSRKTAPTPAAAGASSSSAAAAPAPSPLPSASSTSAHGLSLAAPSASSAVPSPSGASTADGVATNGVDGAAAAKEEEGVKGCWNKCRTPAAKERARTIGKSCLFLVGILYPALVAILMGLYYLYRKYGTDEIYAFAIIWLVFVAVMIVILTVMWRRREAEQRIIDAQIAAEEKHVQELALHIKPTDKRAAATRGGDEEKKSSH